MIQKITRENKKIGKLFLVFAACFLSFGAFQAFAEEAPVNSSGLGADMAIGTPFEEIISAVSSGGLEASGDFGKLRSDTDDQASETPFSPEEIQPNPQPAIGFDSQSIQLLEEKGGLSSRPEIEADTPTAFNLAVKFFERVVFKKDVEFSSRPTFDQGLEISGVPTFDKDTAGYAIIKKGNQSVVVEFEREYDSPPIITTTLSLQQYKNSEVRAVAEDLLLVSDVKYIITNATKKGFEIMMDRASDSDIPFSWHALAVDNPKTYKKKGSSLDGQEGYSSPGRPSVQSENSARLPADAGPAAVQPSESSAPVGGMIGSDAGNYSSNNGNSR